MGKSKKYRFFAHFGAKVVLNDVLSHLIGCAQRSKAFANTLNNFQNFRLPRGVSLGSYWGGKFVKNRNKRHFS